MRASVARLLKEGAQVVAADLAAGFPSKDTVPFEVPNLYVQQCDVTERASVNAAVARFGQIHSLVTCVGAARFAPVLEVKEADWDLQFDLNVRGTQLCIQAVLSQMIDAQYGRIVTVS